MLGQPRFPPAIERPTPAPESPARRWFAWIGLELALCLTDPSATFAQEPSPPPKAEVRGWWVDAFHPGFKNRDEIKRLVADARTGHFNALFVQMRRRGEVFFQSRFEPKAAELPSDFDPLAELLAQARAASPPLEVHAWLVAYPVWNELHAPPPQPAHPFRTHPEWLTRSIRGDLWDGQNYALDPGHPAVQEHLCALVMDLLDHYQLDGVHLDYIRYHSRDWGYNPVTVQRFNAALHRSGQPQPDDPDWLQFRRDQVTGLVRKLYLSVHAAHPAVKLSAATICFAPGITNGLDWPHSAAYADKLQDWRAWMEEGILDLNVPMAYFAEPLYTEAWARWSTFAKDHRYGRQLAMGVGTYLNPLWISLRQLRSTRSPSPLGSAADGVVCYSYAAPGRDGLPRRTFLAALAQAAPSGPPDRALFASSAALPPMPWLAAPQVGSLAGHLRSASPSESLDRASIELTGPVTRTLSPDATGFFGVPDLPPGEYRLKASCASLEFRTASCMVQPGRVLFQDFELAPSVGEDF